MEGLPVGAVLREGEAAPLLAPVWRTATAWQRMRGLLGRPPLQPGQGLWIVPCGSVHTIGMRQALDIVFLDAANRIVKLCRGLVPLRTASAWRARQTLELAPGEIDRLGLAPGQRLTWRS